MFIFFDIMQVGIEQLSSVQSPLIENANVIQTRTLFLIGVVVFVNLVLMVIKFILDLCKGNRDNKNYRRRKISDLSIDMEAKLFMELEKLSNFTKGDEHQMLEEIQRVEILVRSNRIYYSKAIYKKADEILDYYKSINSNLSRKDIKKEEQMLNDYYKKYYE